MIKIKVFRMLDRHSTTQIHLQNHKWMLLQWYGPQVQMNDIMRDVLLTVHRYLFYASLLASQNFLEIIVASLFESMLWPVFIRPFSVCVSQLSFVVKFRNTLTLGWFHQKIISIACEMVSIPNMITFWGSMWAHYQTNYSALVIDLSFS